MGAGYDGSIRIDTSISSSGFNKGVQGMMGSLSKLALAIGIAFSLSAVIAFGKTAVDAASEIQSAFIGLQSIVEGQGKSFMGAKAFIQDYISDGLVPAANAVTAYKNLLMRGYDTTQIETVMNALKNASAFGRQASLTMGQAVQSATEGLKNENSILVDNAGVTKNVSMMWKDYATSIGTTVGALTKAQKIEAEVAGILEETSFQMGDAAKLSQTYSGKVSALGVSFMNLKVAIGNSIIPMINLALPYIKAAIDALVVFFNQVAQIMNALFGTNVSMASIAESTQDAADAQGDLADNVQDATRAAKGALAAFDQLNVLQSENANANGSTTPTDQIPLPSIDDTVIGAGLNALEERVLQFKTKFLEFISPVILSLDNLRVALTPLGETIWAGLKWAWDNILVPLGTWIITDVLPAFLDLLGASAKLLDSILIALEPSWTWFWENVLKPLAEWTGGMIVDFIGSLTDGLIALSDWINEHGESAVLVIEIIAGIVGALLALNWIAGVISAAISFLSLYIIPALTAAFAFLASPIGLIILLIAGIIAVIWLLIANWEQLSTTVKQLVFIMVYYCGLFASAVYQKFSDALEAVHDKFVDIFTGIKNFVKGIINNIIDFINGMILSVVEGINTVIRASNTIGGLVGGDGFSPIAIISAPKIPRLATGAVIPPNAEFAAILGDQRSGRNIEAPESLIRQIVSEEIGNIRADIRIEFGGSLGQLIRELKPLIDKENVRVGNSLITSGVSTS